jgi:hypothetical protein
MQKFQKVYKVAHNGFLLKFIDNLYFIRTDFINKYFNLKMELGSEILTIYNITF